MARKNKTRREPGLVKLLTQNSTHIFMCCPLTNLKLISGVVASSRSLKIARLGEAVGDQRTDASYLLDMLSPPAIILAQGSPTVS